MGTSRTFDVSDAEADDRREVVDEALDANATVMDSSPMYGRAERVLGRTLADRRDAAFVATKVWTNDDGEADKQIDASLEYFGGHIELYQVHNLVAWRRRLDRLERLRDAGQTRLLGATHMGPYDELAEVMRTGRVDAVQVPYNPREREVEREILPLAADLGVGVVIMRPLAKGALAESAPEERELAPLSEYGIRTWGQALLKWVLSNPRCTVAIPATRRPERMRENAEAGSPPWLDDDARAYVARLATRE